MNLSLSPFFSWALFVEYDITWHGIPLWLVQSQSAVLAVSPPSFLPTQPTHLRMGCRAEWEREAWHSACSRQKKWLPLVLYQLHMQNTAPYGLLWTKPTPSQTDSKWIQTTDKTSPHYHCLYSELILLIQYTWSVRKAMNNKRLVRDKDTEPSHGWALTSKPNLPSPLPTPSSSPDKSWHLHFYGVLLLHLNKLWLQPNLRTLLGLHCKRRTKAGKKKHEPEWTTTLQELSASFVLHIFLMNKFLESMWRSKCLEKKFLPVRLEGDFVIASNLTQVLL